MIEGDLNAGTLAPPMIEFGRAGDVVNSWAILSFSTPAWHTCHFDADGNVWVGSAPSGMVQKYTHDGSRLLLQVGRKGVLDSSDGTAQGMPLNSDAAWFFMPASIAVDRQNGDVYVADGEGQGGNRRIVVLDADGNFLRQWTPEGMDTVHCMTIANDGTVYVCNRLGSRIQIKDGQLQAQHRGPVDAGDAPARWAGAAGGRRVGSHRFLTRSGAAAHVRHQPEQRAD